LARRALSGELLALSLAILLSGACESDDVVEPRPSESSARPSSSISAPDEVLETCRGRDALQADVDGDGRTDLVFHTTYHGAVRVGVCTATGAFDTLPGLGMGETLYIEDVQDDGRDEILFGSTSALMEYIRFATWEGDRVKPVLLPDGKPLLVHFGAAFPEEQPFTFYRTSCERTRLPYVQGDVVEVTTVREDRVFRWHATEYSVRGDRASVIGEPRGDSDIRGRSISEFGEELFVRCDPPNP
jgi:hypothetical protein